MPGPDGKPIYDPTDPAFEVRFGHATHATPEQAERMAKLGIIVEANLGSNAVSGSLQDNPTKPQGRSGSGHLNSMDDHSLLALASAGVEIHLSTDGQSVMRTGLRNEHRRAQEIIDDFRGDPARGQPARGKMPVTREVYAAAHPEIRENDIKPPFELRYSELPRHQRENIDKAYERMVEDSMLRQSGLDRDDTQDRRRSTSTELRR